MRSDALVSRGGGGSAPSTLLRILALGVLGLVLVGGVLTLTRRSPRPGAPELPVPLPADSLTGVLVSGGLWRAEDLRQPTLLLYVDERCSWCKAELRTWTELVRRTPARVPVVVASRRSDPGFVPPPLARVLVHDRTGRIARGLRLRGVPAIAVMTPRGVTHLFYGVSGRGRLDSLLHLLDDPSPRPSLSPLPEGALR